MTSENDLVEQSLQQLYEDLKESIRDSVSKNGSGWARRRLRIALVLQKSLSQLTHWGTDIRNVTHKTLEKVQKEDETFSRTIRNQLAVANHYVSQLRELCEYRTNDTRPNTDAEARLAESLQVSIKSLQYQVDPLKEFIESIKQPWAQGVVGPDLDSAAFMTDHARRLLNDPESDLEGLIETCSSVNFEGKRFYSATTLRKSIMASRTTVFLKRQYPGLSDSTIQGLLKQVTTRFVKVFSILLKSKIGDLIIGFVESHFDDHALPLLPDIQERAGEIGHRRMAYIYLQSWTTSEELASFENTQWEFLTPVFDSRHFHHWHLDSRVPLPWQNVTESVDKSIGKSHFSSVEIFLIEPSFHNLFDATAATIAVKSCPTSHSAVVENELNVLSVIHGLNDPHLLQSYGIVEQDQRKRLIFPHAECDLREYWSTVSGVLRNLDSLDLQSSSSSEVFAAWDEMVWVSDQIRGIAQGLATMHDPGNDIFMRHGDIKPENILLMRPSKELRGKLVIGDFGLTHIHTTQTPNDEEQKVEYVTKGYMPPECDIQNGILSRRSDVWSLGCVILEFMCWVLGGNDLNETFAKKRVAHNPRSDHNFSFFEVVEQDGSRIAKIQPAVVECFEQLRRLPHCTAFVSDILSIVQDHMLLLNSHERISARGLVRMLNKTHAKVIASKAYATLPIPIHQYDIKEEQPPVQVMPRVRVGNKEEDKRAANKVESSGGTHSELSSDPPMQLSKPQSRAQEYGGLSDSVNLTTSVIASRMTVRWPLSH